MKLSVLLYIWKPFICISLWTYDLASSLLTIFLLDCSSYCFVGASYILPFVCDESLKKLSIRKEINPLYMIWVVKLIFQFGELFWWFLPYRNLGILYSWTVIKSILSWFLVSVSVRHKQSFPIQFIKESSCRFL